MEETPVTAALGGGVLTLTLNRPQRLNAMSNAPDRGDESTSWRAPSDDPAVRAVLLTGTGRGFCAGADLAGGGPVDRRADGAPDLGAAMDRLFNPMIRAMRALPKPIVRRDQRRGGGRRRQPRARLRHRRWPPARRRFDQAFVRISLMPDLGGTWFLPHTVGDARARALGMLGSVGAGRGGRAHGHGLAGASDDAALMDEATELARRARGRPDALLCRDQAGDQRGRHQHARPAARPRARQPARARPQRRFQGRRRGVPRQAAGATSRDAETMTYEKITARQGPMAWPRSPSTRPTS